MGKINEAKAKVALAGHKITHEAHHWEHMTHVVYFGALVSSAEHISAYVIAGAVCLLVGAITLIPDRESNHEDD